MASRFHYYGLPSPVPPEPELGLQMNVYQSGHVQLNLANNMCHIRHTGVNGWGWAVGSEPLADGAMWKLSVQSLPTSNLMAGIITNLSPQQCAFQDPTFFGWYNNNSIYVRGGSNNCSTYGMAQWPGWTTGDEAIFKFSAAAKTLTAYLKRTGQCYTMPPGTMNNIVGFRICICTTNVNTAVSVTPPSKEESVLLH